MAESGRISRSIGGALLDLLTNKVRCDVTFEVGSGSDKERIECHKLILSSRSSVFDHLLFTDTKIDDGDGNNTLKNDENIIPLPDEEPSIFHSFLKFLYGDIISFNSISEMSKILHLARKYCVTELITKCEEILQSQVLVESVVHIYYVAAEHDLKSLMDFCIETMTLAFSALILDPSFRSIEPELLHSILARDDFDVQEIDLFEALMVWAADQCIKSGQSEKIGKNLRTVLGKSLYVIRFPLMTTLEFLNVVEPKKVLSNQEKWAMLEYIRGGEEDRKELHIPFKTIPRTTDFNGSVVCLTTKSHAVDRHTFVCDGSPHTVRMHPSQKIVLHGLGFGGSVDNGAVYEIGVEITTYCDNQESQSNIVQKNQRIFGKGTIGLCRYMLEEPLPIEPTIKEGDDSASENFTNITFSIKGINTKVAHKNPGDQQRYFIEDTQIDVLWASGSNPLVEILFKRNCE